MATRTPEQIFQHHAEALGAEDLDGIVADYSEDAFFMTSAGFYAARRASGRPSPSCFPMCPRPAGT